MKHIIITGASSGIGKALALHYASDGGAGIMLSLTGRNADRLNCVANACRAFGAEVNEETICVTARESMAEWLLAVDAVQPTDIVIANAGISAGTGGAQASEHEDQVRNIFSINVDGVFNTVHPLIQAMSARKSGNIVLISSLAGIRGFKGAPAYCASKAAVKVYGEGLCGVLKDTSVQVHVVLPGFVKSRMTDVNDFPMPFLMDTEKAARKIAKGIARGKGRIAFPLPMLFFVWLLGACPNALAEFLTKRTPAKIEKQA